MRASAAAKKRHRKFQSCYVEKGAFQRLVSPLFLRNCLTGLPLRERRRPIAEKSRCHPSSDRDGRDIGMISDRGAQVIRAFPLRRAFGAAGSRDQYSTGPRAPQGALVEKQDKNNTVMTSLPHGAPITGSQAKQPHQIGRFFHGIETEKSIVRCNGRWHFLRSSGKRRYSRRPEPHTSSNLCIFRFPTP